jgi:uncharacterized protein YpuA (DUF1002 family)
MEEKGGDTRKDMTNEKIIKVSCDCCGTEIECPDEMMKTSKKHLCYTCFQDRKNFKKISEEEKKNVHVDIPMDKISDTVAQSFASTMAREVFPEIWSKEKENLKAFSKKELAQEMFEAGVYLGIQELMDCLGEIREQEQLFKRKTKR